MLIPDERKLLSWLTERLYRGFGEIVELGAFIGSSSVSLASGLNRSSFLPDEQKGKRIHAFDRFTGEFEADWIRKNTNLPLDEDGGFRSSYRAHTQAFERFIEVRAGDLLTAAWEKPIEILFIDMLKSKALTDKIVRSFFPYLVPGRSIIIQQDYLFHILPYSVVLMEHFADYFERAGDTGSNSVIFVNTKKIPDAMLANFSWDDMPEQLRLHYLMQAIGKQETHRQREFVAHQLADFVTGKYR